MNTVIGSLMAYVASGFGALLGTLFGLSILTAGMYLAYHSEAVLVNHGRVFDAVKLTAPNQATAQGELVKIHGRPTGDFLSTKHFDAPVIYLRETIDRYTGSNDEKADVIHGWETVSSTTQWAPFMLGDITVIPHKARPMGEREIHRSVKSRQTGGQFDAGFPETWAAAGDLRRVIHVIEADTKIVVFGRLTGKTISGGSTFIVSRVSESVTGGFLHTDHKMHYQGLKVAALLCIWVGFLWIFRPLVAALPIAWPASLLTFMPAITFLVLAALVTLIISVLAVYFWYAAVAVALLVLVLASRRLSRAHRQC